MSEVASLSVAIVSRRVHPAHGPGGLEKHVYDQVRHLANAGVKVDLYTETPTDGARMQLMEQQVPAGVRVTWVERGTLPLGRVRGTIVLDRITNYPSWARRVPGSIRGRPDVIHVHGLGGLGVAAERHNSGVPVVLTTHGMEEFRSPGRLKHLLYAPFRQGIRRIAAASDVVVATDEALLRLVQNELRLPGDRLVVIPNAIDPQECTSEADTDRASSWLSRRNVEGSELLLVSVGRLAPNKGFALLAEALGAAAANLPSRWHWLLIGDGPERHGVEAAVRRAGIGDHCTLAGAVDDQLKHGLLAAADWFVHPTLYEGSSLVTLEAMAHRLPVLATRTGGLPDKVIEGETGLLVEAGNLAALVAALCTLVGHDGARLGCRGRQLLQERFSWAAVTPKYLELYRSLVRAPR